MTEQNQTPKEAEAPAFALPVDQWHGKGGEYVMVDGVRTRVAGPPLDGEPPAEPHGEPQA